MTSVRLWNLLQHAADLHLEVEWRDLGPTRRGEYRRAKKVIILSTRLTDAQAVSTLAHELGHHRFADRCSTPGAERRAWRYAAALVVTPQEYRAAEAVVGHHPNALAAELGVTSRLVRAWCDWWGQLGVHLPRSTWDGLREYLEDDDRAAQDSTA
ncbi:ImmA/IrrE family metallo-endopeptidase [Nocardioides sp. ChNu-99]|uniref:ImmA/IrrE family metallo-endopeptidase n=1 Tax=Nocardioides sp. ChNu-99 TaxID=2839897 RepID=UPI0024073FD2|nr:ImmA/IrrE family metallo-endopeptidase [Nocardioides sp. ChNu-99]MDF9717642.1 ImmA/IrrE family metallo-endopeptidase [Nocardioides sp. ChNu-99]